MRANCRQIIVDCAAGLCCFATALVALPACAGADRWTAIGPDGANIVALAIDPHTPSRAFAGTLGAGVLKSTDGGASWAIANSGLPTANVSALAASVISRFALSQSSWLRQPFFSFVRSSLAIDRHGVGMPCDVVEQFGRFS